MKIQTLTSAMAPPQIPFQACSSLCPLQSVLHVQACSRDVQAACLAFLHWKPVETHLGKAWATLSLWSQLGILDCPLPISIFPLTHASATNVFSNDDDNNKTLLILQFSELNVKESGTEEERTRGEGE